MIEPALVTIPPGRWLVGVSGGADSVALLCGLTRARADVEPVVVHLDHETRGAGSAEDAAFVTSLARTLCVACVSTRLSALDPIDEPNDEARFRLARRRLFERVAIDRDAHGVLLAHHADDRAETTMLRLLRGGEPTALAGLRGDVTLGPLRVLRPLLTCRRSAIEAFLRAVGQPWRTDSTNASDRFARNRVRRLLAARRTLVAPLLALADAADGWAGWVAEHAPSLGESFAADALADAPAPLARSAARRWLRTRGASSDALSAAVVDRLIAMSADRATPSRQTFPGAIDVRRRQVRIEAKRSR